MKRKYKPVIRVLAIIMVVVCLGVALAPASFAFAGVLDPAAWLYPIWSMYGAQNGVNVSTTGNADFTIDGMKSLWNEYQASRVSSGLQQVAQTITDFVNGVKGFVSVIAGAVTGGTLNTKLMLGAGIVGALDAFWNWIITDKLGGTDVDSTDFDSTSGNLVSVESSLNGQPFAADQYTFVSKAWANNNWELSVNPSNSETYFAAFLLSGGYWIIGYTLLSGASYTVQTYQQGLYTARCNIHNAHYDGFYGYVTDSWRFQVAQNLAVIPVYESLDAALAGLSEMAGGNVNVGSLTVSAESGVDVLGFPDASDQAYVPADAVIPWNIPYDYTKDTDAYIDAAFADAVSGDLTIGEEGEVIQPVPGVGPVGDYVAVGLGDVFPFCIPFDIYDFLSALAADPVAPSFTAELAFPEAVGGTQYVELDFDTPTFNQLASILRTMELLAFIVGLAFLTRSMFIRG